jgi:hypothetical protein
MSYTGFFKAKIITINPDDEWVSELMEESITQEPFFCEEYDKKHARLDFYLEDPKQRIFKYSITVTDEIIVSKNDSYLFINCLGDTQWAKTESQLWDSFKYFEKVTEWEDRGGKKFPKTKDIVGEKAYHESRKGEVELLNIVKAATEFNPYDPESSVLVNLEKILSGDISSLEKIFSFGKDFHLTAFAYLDKQMRQCIWKDFLPLNFIRDVSSTMQVSSFNKRMYENWLKNLQGDYGVDGHYVLDKLQLLKEEHIQKNIEITDTNLEY